MSDQIAPMKLSTAIRLGAMLKPQAFGATYDGVGTCAVGAAKDAVGRLYDEFPAVFPESDRAQWADCPACGRVRGYVPLVSATIPHLNDDHRWTREQIADWVESIEAQHEQPKVETPQPVSVEV